MVKPTKNAKTIEVKWTMKTYTEWCPKYHCPTCGVYFEGGLREETIVFRCKCGQVLKVKEGIHG